MDKINYLNIGCGNKYRRDWVNINLRSYNSDVIACDALEGIPFDDNTFEVVYMAQFLEHVPKKHAPEFIRDCHRILKQDGVIRIVVPNLEDITRNYLKFLEKNLSDPTEESIANYDWILLEMYDQAIRNISGGEMAEFLRNPTLINEQFVLNRIGFIGKDIRRDYLKEQQGAGKNPIKKLLKYMILKIAMPKSFKIGSFRLNGEVHYWMYDRYSLNRLLKDCNFREIKVVTPFDSDIPEWNKYELDVKDGQVYDPFSLFMEARK